MSDKEVLASSFQMGQTLKQSRTDILNKRSALKLLSQIPNKTSYYVENSVVMPNSNIYSATLEYSSVAYIIQN